MAAGIIPTGQQVVAPDQPVQLLTSTWDTFNHYYFAYQMLTAIEVLIFCFLFWVFRPYLPFLISKLWTHLPVVGLMNRVRNCAPFGGFLLRNGMYRKEMRNMVMYFTKKYLGSFFFMGCAFDIVHIDRGFVQDPIMNKYVVSLTNQGYPRWRNVQDALDVNEIDPNSEIAKDMEKACKCKDFDELHGLLNPYGLTTTTLLYAPKYSNIPQDALIKYGKDVTPGTLAALIDHWYEFLKPDIEKDKLMEWLPYIILIIVICLGGYILAMAVQHGAK